MKRPSALRLPKKRPCPKSTEEVAESAPDSAAAPTEIPDVVATKPGKKAKAKAKPATMKKPSAATKAAPKKQKAADDKKGSGGDAEGATNSWLTHVC